MANEAISLLDRVESITASRRKAQTQRLQKFAPLLQQAIQGEELKRKEASDLNYWQNRASVDGIDIGKYTESGLTPQQGYDIGLREKQAEDARNAPLLAEKKRVEANVNRLEQDPMFAEYSKQFPMGEKDSDVYIGEFNEYKNKKALVDAQSTDPTYQVFAKGFDVNNASMEDTQMHIAQFKGWKAKQKALLEAGQDASNRWQAKDTAPNERAKAEIANAFSNYYTNDSREIAEYNKMVQLGEELEQLQLDKNYKIRPSDNGFQMYVVNEGGWVDITNKETLDELNSKVGEIKAIADKFNKRAIAQAKSTRKEKGYPAKLDDAYSDAINDLGKYERGTEQWNQLWGVLMGFYQDGVLTPEQAEEIKTIAGDTHAWIVTGKQRPTLGTRCIITIRS